MGEKRLEIDAPSRSGVRVPTGLRARMGYNHQLAHGGRGFHVQTEDSGEDRRRIFTHVFHHGAIVATNRVDYPEGTPSTDVTGLLRQSHRTMVRKLVRGELDDAIERFVGRSQDQPSLVVEHAPSAAAAPPVEGRSDEPPVSSPPQDRRTVGALDPEQIVWALDEVFQTVPGVLGIALADSDSGLCLGAVGPLDTFALEIAVAGNMDVMKAKAAVLREIGLGEGIEDILVTLDTQYHVIRPMGSALFFFLSMDRARGNLAMGRLKLAAVASRLLG